MPCVYLGLNHRSQFDSDLLCINPIIIHIKMQTTPWWNCRLRILFIKCVIRIPDLIIKLQFLIESGKI